MSQNPKYLHSKPRGTLSCPLHKLVLKFSKCGFLWLIYGNIYTALKRIKSPSSWLEIKYIINLTLKRRWKDKVAVLSALCVVLPSTLIRVSDWDAAESRLTVTPTTISKTQTQIHKYKKTNTNTKIRWSSSIGLGCSESQPLTNLLFRGKIERNRQLASTSRQYIIIKICSLCSLGGFWC